LTCGQVGGRVEQVEFVGSQFHCHERAPRQERDTELVTTWADAAQLPLCLLNPAMRGRQILDTALAEHDITLNPQVEADSIAAIYSFVATGRWASIVPHSWVHPFRADRTPCSTLHYPATLRHATSEQSRAHRALTAN
jgi:DNA-binding transcriptional LysR family regulator